MEDTSTNAPEVVNAEVVTVEDPGIASSSQVAATEVNSKPASPLEDPIAVVGEANGSDKPDEDTVNTIQVDHAVDPEITQEDTTAEPDHSKDNESIHSLSDDEIQIDSNSESESDSSSSSSESDSDSDSDSDAAVDGDEVLSDNEDDKITGPIISKNEVINEVAPSLPEDYTLADKPIEPIGKITGFVDNSVIIKGDTSAEFRVLKEKSVLCLKDKVIGPLFEIFGNLKMPVYRVKFNEPDKVEEFKALKGEEVFYVVPDSEFTLTETLKSFKGSDASNFNDEEIPAEEQEFSDDEKEMAAKRKRKGKNPDKVQSKKEKPSRSLHNQGKRTFTTYNQPQQFTSYNAPQEPSFPQSPQTQPSLYGSSLPYKPQFVNQTNRSSINEASPYGVPMNSFQQPFASQQHQPQQPFPHQQPQQPFPHQQPQQPFPHQQPSSLPPTPSFAQPYRQPYNQPLQYGQPMNDGQPYGQYNPTQSQPNSNQNDQLTNALANASPEQLKLLEQLLKSQLNK
ncbi:hypothetical protein PSN45_001604 [Yamadazyma tenuis]|nr:hypothetical protein PSN45_001604 [Yamadazyma tenuis]